MSPFKASNPLDLKINLAAPPNWSFAPGDRIIGTVARHSPIVSHDAQIRVSFCGTAETRMLKRDGNQRHWLTCRWDLLESQHIELVRGPLHLAEGSDACLIFPFELHIPLRPSVTLITRRKNESSYLPVDQESVERHTLPGTFFGSNGKDSSGFIKYTIEAELQYSRGGETIKHTDAIPIVIRYIPDDPPLVHPEMTQLSTTARLETHRLVASRQTLSMRQKMQNIVGSSKVPKLTYRVEITAPEAVQIDHPDPIPMTLNIVGVPDKTSEVLHDTVVTVTVQSIRINITAMTSIYVRGLNGPKSPSDFWRKTHSVDVAKSKHDFLAPVKFDVGGNTCPFNIGIVKQLSLGSDGLRTGRKPQLKDVYASRGLQVRSIYPDFVSYIVKHRHGLECELSVEIAGKTQTVSVYGPLKLLPAD